KTETVFPLRNRTATPSGSPVWYSKSQTGCVVLHRGLAVQTVYPLPQCAFTCACVYPRPTPASVLPTTNTPRCGIVPAPWADTATPDARTSAVARTKHANTLTTEWSLTGCNLPPLTAWSALSDAAISTRPAARR